MYGKVIVKTINISLMINCFKGKTNVIFGYLLRENYPSMSPGTSLGDGSLRSLKFKLNTYAIPILFFHP